MTQGLRIKDTPILKGYQLFHNFIRPHEVLEGKTPAQKAGMDVFGENKWKSLIENASQAGDIGLISSLILLI